MNAVPHVQKLHTSRSIHFVNVANWDPDFLLLLHAEMMLRRASSIEDGYARHAFVKRWRDTCRMYRKRIAR